MTTLYAETDVKRNIIIFIIIIPSVTNADIKANLVYTAIITNDTATKRRMQTQNCIVKIILQRSLETESVTVIQVEHHFLTRVSRGHTHYDW